MSGRGFTVNKDWDNPVEHAMPAETRVPAEVRLGAVVVRPATVLAPMAGVRDTVFRRFIRPARLFTHSGPSEDGGVVCQGPNCEGPGAPPLTGTPVPLEGPGVPGHLGEDAIEAAVSNAQSGCGLLVTEF